MGAQILKKDDFKSLMYMTGLQSKTFPRAYRMPVRARQRAMRLGELDKFKLKNIFKPVEKAVKAVVKPVKKVAALAIATLAAPKLAKKITGIQLTEKEWRNVKVAKKVGIAVGAVAALPYVAAGAIKMAAITGKVSASVMAAWLSPINKMRLASGKPPLSISRIGDKIFHLKRQHPQISDAEAFEKSANSEADLQDQGIAAARSILKDQPLQQAVSQFVADKMDGQVEKLLGNTETALQATSGEVAGAVEEHKEADREAAQASMGNLPMFIMLGIGVAGLALGARRGGK